MGNAMYFYIKCGYFGDKRLMAILVQRKLHEKDYILQFLKKLKLCTKLVLRQYMKVFASKFICHNFCLLFILSIIYLKSTAKLSSATGTSH